MGASDSEELLSSKPARPTDIAAAGAAAVDGQAADAGEDGQKAEVPESGQGASAQATEVPVDVLAAELASPGIAGPGIASPGMAPAAAQPADAAGRRHAALSRSLLLPVCDTLALVTAGLIVGLSWTVALYVVVVLIALNISGSNRLRICMRVFDEIPRLTACAVVPAALFLPWAGSAKRFVALGVISACLLTLGRAGLYYCLRAAHRNNRLTEPALIVGTSELGHELGELLGQHPELGLRPVGFVGNCQPPWESELPFLGDLSMATQVVERLGVSRLIVSYPADNDEDLVAALRTQCPAWVHVYVVPRVYEVAMAIPLVYLDEVWGIPLAPLRRCGIPRAGRVVKRGFDVLLGTALFVLTAPIMLALVVMEFFSSGRPVIFRQERVTCSGRVTKILKLRTVRSSPLPQSDSQWTVPAENLSAVAKWLRATHLDELPQLVNVIRGDMSLVGPRPERPYFTAKFARVIPHYDDRHRTRTGMTGWAQVHGLTGDTSISERVRFDNYYIEHWSLWLDAVILVRTAAEPLTGFLRSLRSRTRN